MDASQFSTASILVRSEGADVPYEEMFVDFQADLGLDMNSGS